MSMRSQKGTVWLQIVLRWSLSQKEKCLGSRWRRASLSWGSKYAWMLFWVSFSIFDKDLLVNKMLNLPFWQYSFKRQMLDTLGSCLLSQSQQAHLKNLRHLASLLQLEKCSRTSEDENLLFNSHSKLFIVTFLWFVLVPVLPSYLNTS